MDLEQIEPLLNMSPYALFIVFGVWLVRWFQKEYWPHIKNKELNREKLFAQAVADIATLKSEIEENRNVQLDAKGDILEALRSVENLLTIQLKADKK
jgi:hypothetical protein